MEFLDRKTAATFAGRGLAMLLLAFMCLIIALWWFQVLKFFFWDHWKVTGWVMLVCLAWYVIGRAIEQVEREARAMHRRNADPNYYGDDDCA